MDNFVNPDEKIMCPYNPAHHIMRRRMNTHLVKCKKNYPDTKLIECDFNVTHKIPEPELQYHHENCPDRGKIEISIYQEQGVDINKYPIPIIDVPTDESWDDYNVPTYDPKKYCEGREILRHLDVASAGQKRQFRMEERKRFSQFTNSSKSATRPSAGISRTSGSVAPSSSKELPPTRSFHMNEDTPSEVEALLARIKSQAGQSYRPVPNNS